MTSQATKITIYSSPQDAVQATPVVTSVKTSTPQRTTYRVRISNAKDLELLQSAMANGNATLGGQKIRIVGLQPSAGPSSTECDSITPAAGVNCHPGYVVNGFRFSSPLNGITAVNGVHSVAGLKSQTGLLLGQAVPASQAAAVSVFGSSADVLPTYREPHNSSVPCNVKSSCAPAHFWPSPTSVMLVTPPTNASALHMLPSSAGWCDARQNSVSFGVTSMPTVAATNVAPQVCLSRNDTKCAIMPIEVLRTDLALPLLSRQPMETTSSSSIPFQNVHSQSVYVNNCASGVPLLVNNHLPGVVSAAVSVPGMHLSGQPGQSAPAATLASSARPHFVNLAASLPVPVSGARYIGSVACNAKDIFAGSNVSSHQIPGQVGNSVSRQRFVFRIKSDGSIDSPPSAEQLPQVVKFVKEMIANSGKTSGIMTSVPLVSAQMQSFQRNGMNSMEQSSPVIGHMAPAHKPFVELSDVLRTVTPTDSVTRTNQGSLAVTAHNCGSVFPRAALNTPNGEPLKRPVLYSDILYSLNNSLAMGVLCNNNNNPVKSSSISRHQTSVKKIPSTKIVKGANVSRFHMKNIPSNHIDGCHLLKNVDRRPAESQSCARHCPFVKRKKRGTFSFLMSKHRKIMFTKSVCGGDRFGYEEDLPEAMRLLQNKFVRKSFGVYRSPIQGLGLFARRNIADGDVVIEYAGEVIRSTVADVRERRYESQGIGCYMFRHGDDDVVDATKCGNFARFINHSCQPNCYSREIVAKGRRHIMIFALRAIRRGEELTYDYKFPLEEVKMPCLCKAPRCRRYLN